jgi:hypothetical protein
VQEYAALATTQGKGKLDYEAFACEWNVSANEKDQFYITTEVLATYSKTSGIRLTISVHHKR